MRSVALVLLLEPGAAPVVVAVALPDPLVVAPLCTASRGRHSMIPLFGLPTGIGPERAEPRSDPRLPPSVPRVAGNGT
jgi:hypothetical protein